jgi:hypothetical protein
MKTNQVRPDTPLATTPINILDELQKVSVARLALKRESRKSKKEVSPLKSSTSSIQGLASLKNTLGKKITSKTK